MRIVVTGGTGWIGTHTVLQLRARGHDVLVLTRDISRAYPALAALGIPCVECRYDRTTLPSSTLTALSLFKPTACLHLAGDVQRAAPPAVHDEILRGSEVLIAELSYLGCERFVGAGTCFEYSSRRGSAPNPAPENKSEDGFALRGPRPSAGVVVDSAYVKGKRRLHRALLAAWTSPFGTWARIHHVYGPGQQRRYLSRLLAAVRAGVPTARPSDAVRDWIHVDDVASALIACLESKTVLSTVSVGTDIRTSGAMLEDAIECALASVGAPAPQWLPPQPLPPGEPLEVVVTDPQPLGWLPKFSLFDGLLDMWRKDHA